MLATGAAPQIQHHHGARDARLTGPHVPFFPLNAKPTESRAGRFCFVKQTELRVGMGQNETTRGPQALFLGSIYLGFHFGYLLLTHSQVRKSPDSAHLPRVTFEEPGRDDKSVADLKRELQVRGGGGGLGVLEFSSENPKEMENVIIYIYTYIYIF